MKLAVTAIITAILLPSIAASATKCLPTSEMREALNFSYGETRLATGISELRGNMLLIEIWRSIDSGSFTILVTSPNQVSCIPVSGEFFFVESNRQEPKGTIQ